MYQPVTQRALDESLRLVEQAEKELFAFLDVGYQVNNILIGQGESIHSVFVPSTVADKNKCQNYYLSHGFGGSALMSFAIMEPLLKKGNVIFWEIRGMGFGKKLNQYPLDDVNEIERFFLKSIQALLHFYKHQNCTFIGHSFSSYLLLLFCIRHPESAKSQMKKLLLLSAIGITSKEQDYKNSINGIGDVFQTLLNKFGWAFNLTYKSPLRTICSCCKQSLVRSSLKSTALTEPQQNILGRIIQTLILLPDGSECLFFKFFEPRVLPKIALEPLITENIPKLVFIYGGQQDWVDKSGAKRLCNRYPDKVSFKDFEGIGHNIPFNSQVCNQIFTEYL